MAILRQTQTIGGFKYRQGEWFIILDTANIPIKVVKGYAGAFFPSQKYEVCENDQISKVLIGFFVTHQSADKHHTER